MTTRTDSVTASLPGDPEVGQSGTWNLPLTDDQDQTDVLTFTGRFLGVWSSRRPYHSRHDGQFADPGERCSACRWFEPRIFRVDDADPGAPLERDGYVVHYVGGTIVPGEVMRCRADKVATANEVLEVLTTRRGDKAPFLTVPAARVLAQAATYDDDLDNAYVNRAVP